MKLNFDTKFAKAYSSPSQKVRILTENWVSKQIFCPNCGRVDISRYPNNKPVADFFCPNCKEDYELKSKQGSMGRKITDGAYGKMIERLQSGNNPNFFFLNYNLKNLKVSDFAVIPKHFFVPEIIEKRKPLSSMAVRAGWVGCNIVIKNIPETGKIFFVKNGIVEPKKRVLSEWVRTLFLREEKDIKAKGWLLDIMKCIEKLCKQQFTLDEVYKFEKELSLLHTDNHHVKDKIRQKLQVLRDKGYLNFVSPGKYSLSK